MTRAEIVSKIRSSQGLDATPPSDWTYAQRIAYNKALAAEILAHPELNTPAVAAIAERILNQPTAALEEFSTLDALGVFTAEFVNQAEEINPFSERNRGTLSLVLVAAILLYVGVSAYNHSKGAAPAPAAA